MSSVICKVCGETDPDKVFADDKTLTEYKALYMSLLKKTPGTSLSLNVPSATPLPATTQFWSQATQACGREWR